MIVKEEMNSKESSPRVVSSGKMIKSSVRKINLVAKFIRGKSVFAASEFLKFCQKTVAYDVSKVLKSAMANAENNYALDLESLYVKEAFVGKALTLKRFSPRAKGRGVRISKKFSKITIVLGELES